MREITVKPVDNGYIVSIEDYSGDEPQFKNLVALSSYDVLDLITNQMNEWKEQAQNESGD